MNVRRKGEEDGREADQGAGEVGGSEESAGHLLLLLLWLRAGGRGADGNNNSTYVVRLGTTTTVEQSAGLQGPLRACAGRCRPPALYLRCLETHWPGLVSVSADPWCTGTGAGTEPHTASKAHHTTQQAIDHSLLATPLVVQVLYRYPVTMCQTWTA